MKIYQAILFDLFDTLVDLNHNRFPIVRIGGEEKHSTSGAVYEVFQAFYHHIDFERFHQVFVSVSRERERRRNEAQWEFPSEDRVHHLLRELGIGSPSERLVERLVLAHMEKMFEAMEFPPERRPMLDALKPAYRLGIVSNFDHPPTVYRMLRHYDLVHYFDTIVISGEVGWRKPRKEIFLKALETLAIPPEKILFIGDTASHDVGGAKAVGMDAAWLNRLGQPLPPGLPQPEFELSRIEDLPGLLRRE
jgi:putative hydrolase of the HAD superfamily